MKIELKNYPIVIDKIKYNASTSMILNFLEFFQLNDDPNKEIYFRDRRYIDLEGPDNIATLKENDLIEFININDMTRVSTLQQLSDTIHIYVCGRYISTIDTTRRSISNVNQKINKITEHYDTFTIEFECTNEIIAQVFINRYNPESSYITI